MSVAWRPLRACSTDAVQALYHTTSNSTSVFAILLQVLVMRRASLLPSKACWSPWNCCIRFLMRLSRCRAQAMLPATDGMFRESGGWFLHF